MHRTPRLAEAGVAEGTPESSELRGYDLIKIRQPSLNAIMAMVEEQRLSLFPGHATIQALNVGINAGVAAGQTVMHVHIHLIPRRVGDVPDPLGGVRGVIPQRQNYPLP